MTCDLKVFLYYLRKQWGEAEVAWKSTRPLQTTNLNSRKLGTVLSLWAHLVLQSRTQAGLVVKCNNEFRNVSEIKDLTQQTPRSPWKNYRDGLLPFKAFNAFHRQFSTH